MKKRVILIVFILIFIPELFAGFQHHKERGNFNFYYDKKLNQYSLEYIISLTEIFDMKCKKKFFCTNSSSLDIYLYNDTARFINEQKGRWWQKYVIKSNSAAVNNIELLLQQNGLKNLLKYIIYRNNIINSFKNRLPVWFSNGLAIYYSDETFFKNKGLKFSSFEEFVKKLDNYTTKEECEQANYNCCKSIKYLVDNFGEDKILEYIKTIKTEKEFENKFYNFFKTTYKDFIKVSMNL